MSSKACATCRHFDAAPRSLERRFPGLAALSSADAAVRSRDGLCALHDRYIVAESVCSAYARSRPAR
jgi:hypothetical protein